jgi:hypothetical protein
VMVDREEPHGSVTVALVQSDNDVMREGVI